ncbi:MAG: glycoside hydrolase [Candidatus Aenigmatarchaeota archaeon]
MDVCYIPWLHMHQPLVWVNGKIVSNLEKMLNSKDSRESWDARLMLRAYKNPAKYVEMLAKEDFKPKIMLDFSGILLESLLDFDERKISEEIEIGGEKVGAIINSYKKILKEFHGSIEFVGTSYSHCYFPATPKEDWKLQIEMWRETFKKIFGSSELKKIKGFWLPEMGVPGKEEDLSELIRCVKEYYEWMILPVQSLHGYESLSYEKIVEIFCKPHLLQAGNEEITIIFRVPTYFIDQQAGCLPEMLYSRCLEAKKIFSKVSSKPALLVTASDGENGNVMMNEFFPQTFVPFFKEKIGKEVFSLTVSEFLEKFYVEGIEEKVRLKDIGASWIDGHEAWMMGSKRFEAIKRIFSLSKKFHELRPEQKSKVKKWLLIAETSCYVYWGIDYWFDQGKKFSEYFEDMIKEVKIK